eukprot:gene24590-31548_t
MTLVVPALAQTPAWYTGIDSITVLQPGQPGNQAKVDAIHSAQQFSQFGARRDAVLLLPGVYTDLNITTGYYTSVVGAGASSSAVQVGAVESFDGPNGGATCIFWRSAEGVAVKRKANTWATSQACPLRRMSYAGDLFLGGFMSSSLVNGTLHTGTQQQFMFRNNAFSATNAVDYSDAGWNYVFVGSTGAPATSTTSKPDQITTIATTPTVAEKPYLVANGGGGSSRSSDGDRDGGGGYASTSWSMVVPPVLNNLVGLPMTSSQPQPAPAVLLLPSGPAGSGA